MRKNNGFTLITVVGAVIVFSVVVISFGWLIRGCGAVVNDNLIVNPLHSSTAKIQVLTGYFASNELGNIYRIYAKVVEDTDAGVCETGKEHSFIKCPHETFEIEDSFIDGNYRTADLFGELKSSEQTGKVFEIEMRGERSGISGTGKFRQIHSVTTVGESE